MTPSGVSARLALLLAVAVVALAASAAPAAAGQSGSDATAFQQTRLAVGGSHSCAIAGDGRVRCWGLGASGRLGYGNTASIGDNETPGSVGPVDLGAGRTATAITAGTAHTCALLDNGTVRCWGLGSVGRLGYGNTTTIGDNEPPASAGPVDLGAGRTATAISAGDTHTCARLDNGTVRCWGNGGDGRLGYGDVTAIGDNETPGSVGPVDLGAGRTATAIAAGINHTCARLDNGSVRCWGFGGDGELGYASFANVGDDETPGSIGPVDLGAGRSATAIAGGLYHTCARLDNGSVRCWGEAGDGQLGYGNTTDIGDNETPGSAGPVNLGTGRSATAIVAGAVHTCARLDNGSVRCWGYGETGRLGYGNTTSIGDNETPGSVGPVDLGAGRTATALAAGITHTCARLDDDSVRCWGDGADGRLGYASTTTIGDDETPGSAGPVQLGAGRSATVIAAGDGHTCARLDDGSVRCWGLNTGGQLGYGNATTIGDTETPGSAGPVDLGPGRTATTISAGLAHTCALLDNGTVRCWGEGATGQLGYANTTDIGDTETPGSAGPVDIGTGRTATAISAGEAHTCALLDNGTVRCWGFGAFGRLGYGNTTTIGDTETPGSAGPVDLGTGRTATAITGGEAHTCALLDNGTVRCWGEGANGRLGYANTTDIGDTETPGSAGPVDLGTGRTATVIAAGEAHTCAVLDNGSVRCWGFGANGRLGYASTTAIGDTETPGSAGPVDLGTGRSAIAITGGVAHTCALLDNGSVRCWGAGIEGRLGYASTTTIGDDETPGSAGPVDLGAGRSATAVGAGGDHTCARLDNGSVRCWGFAGFGRLGYANTTDIGDNETPGSVGPVDLIDDPPVAVTDAATVTEDAPAAAVDLLTNDSDADGGPRRIVSASDPANGSVTLTGPGPSFTGLSYRPDPDYCNTPGAEDTFSYTLTGADGSPAGGSTTTAAITVTCVDDAPVAVGDVATVLEDAPPSALAVLANDSDVDGGPKAIVSASDPANGSVTLTGAGPGFAGLSYRPDRDYCNEPGAALADTFSYTLAGPGGAPTGGTTTTVAVAVTCVDDPPAASPALCNGRRATLLDVALRGRNVTVTGIALRTYAGQTATIVNAGRTVASARIAADGTFSATFRAPRSAAARRAARYAAILRDTQTARHRLQRELVITSRRTTGGGLILRARLTAAAGRRPRTVTVFRQDTCSTRTRLGTATVARDGTFTVTLPAPTTAGEVAIYRIRAAIRGARTYSVPIAVRR